MRSPARALALTLAATVLASTAPGVELRAHAVARDADGAPQGTGAQQVMPAPPGPPASPTAAPWRTLRGSWSATGRRHTIAAEDGRLAEIVYLSGAVVLTTSAGISHGFRGELIGYDDGVRATVGRIAWTDQRGDRVFGEIQGGPLHGGQELTVTFTGGTGAYRGIIGALAVTWQYMVSAEDQAIQVRTTRLEGRYRLPGGTP